jgi:hypothetical protein
MRKKIFHTVACLMLISNSLLAQQWTGSSTTTGSVSRDGNVGIGTSSPGHALDVRGNIYTSNSVIVDGGDLILNRTSNPYGFVLRPNVSGFKNLGFAVQGGGNLDLFHVVSNMSVFTGNVGIGTATLGSCKLAVEGRIGAREVLVTVNPFPDYVFTPSYKLRDLSSLEKYIKQYSHLHGIPSAAEVEKEGGVKLGEMSVKLLEKIEELTLYIIDMNKKIEELQKDNAALRSQLKD